MQLIELELDNFRQHIHSVIRFGDGVTGVIGRNGAGKTTILEAIAWTLYGAPALRGNVDTIRCRSSQAGAKPQVRLVFELGGHTYTVTRRLDGATLAIDGVGARTGLTEVTRAVVQLLKMDYHAFFTSFFTRQKELTFMADMEARQKAQTISRMLGYDRLTKARDQANKDRNLLDREISGLEQGLGNPEDIKQRLTAARKATKQAEMAVVEAEARTAALRSQVEEQRPRKQLMDETAKRHGDLTRRLELDRTRRQDALAKHKELGATLVSIAEMAAELASIAPLLEEFRTVEAEYRRLQDLQKHEIERQGITRDLDRLKQECDKLEQQIRELASARESQATAQAKVTEAETRLKQIEVAIQNVRDQWMSRRAALQAEAERLRLHHKEIEHKRAEIESAGSDGRCPTCERELGADLAIVLANFDGQIRDADKSLATTEKDLATNQNQPEELTELIAQRTSLENDLSAVRKAKEEVDAALRDLTSAEKDLASKRAQEAVLKTQLDKIPSGFDQTKMDKALARGRELKPTERKSIELQTEIAKRPEREKELADLTAAIELRDKEITEAEAALKEMAFSPEAHQKLTVQFESACQELAGSERQLEILRGDARVAMAELAAVEAEDAAYQKKESQLKEKRSERLYLSSLTQAFENLRIDLDARTRPELEAAASELLSEMTDGRYGELEIDEGYRATIRDDGELKPVISGGEDDIVNLSLRLAISQMIADRAGQPFSLLILDEVFGSLDESRRGNVVDMLLNLKNRFRQIIVITHIESIYDMVDNCIWVDYDEQHKISRIVEKREASLSEL